MTHTSRTGAFVTGLLCFTAILCSGAQGSDNERLSDAARRGDIKAVRELVEKGTDVNAGTLWVPPPLVEAAQEGHVDGLRFLLEHGAHHMAGDREPNALTRAALKGHLDVVRLLLENGGDANGRDEIGLTALIIAAEAGALDVVRLLLDRGADVNAKSTDGTALQLAKDKGQTRVVELLKAHGAR